MKIWVPATIQAALAGICVYVGSGNVWYGTAFSSALGTLLWCTEMIVEAINEKKIEPLHDRILMSSRLTTK